MIIGQLIREKLIAKESRRLKEGRKEEVRGTLTRDHYTG